MIHYDWACWVFMGRGPSEEPNSTRNPYLLSLDKIPTGKFEGQRCATVASSISALAVVPTVAQST